MIANTHIHPTFKKPTINGTTGHNTHIFSVLHQRYFMLCFTWDEFLKLVHPFGSSTDLYVLLYSTEKHPASYQMRRGWEIESRFYKMKIFSATETSLWFFFSFHCYSVISSFFFFTSDSTFVLNRCLFIYLVFSFVENGKKIGMLFFCVLYAIYCFMLSNEKIT